MSKSLESVPAAYPDRHFSADYLKADLKGRSIRSGAVTAAAQACKFVLTFGSMAVLARLLTPQDFGLISMVTAFTGLASLFRDMGLSMATVQRPHIDHAQVSTLFWVNVAISVAITSITAMLGPLIAWFYGEPRLKWITIVSAVAFIFGGLTVQHQALLRRQMRFTALAIIEVVSMLAGIIVAITSGLYGAGYWALVLNQLVVGVTTAMGVWILCDWRPGLPVGHSGVRSMLAFGGNLTGANVLNHFVRNFDNVLIGWYWGAQQLGLYTRAYQLLLLPIRHFNIPVSSIAIPVLSRLQSQPDRYRAYYCRGILLITMVGMPLVAFLFITADKLVLAILGAQWLDAVIIFQILAPAAFIGTFNVATGWIYVSLGQVSRQLRWSVVSSTVTVMSFILGICWGPLGVATTFTVSQLILQIPSILYCYKNSPLRLFDLAVTLLRPTYAATGAAITLVVITRLIPINAHVSIELLLSCLLYISLYLAFFIIPYGGREILLEVLQMAKSLRKL